MRFFLLLVATVAVAGCGSSAAPSPTAVPTRVAVATAAPRPTATIALGAAYLGFVHGLCSALGARNASAVASDLMNYQYNSGLRWGMMGDGEGTTSSPSLLGTWLANSHVRCVSITPGSGGHGALLTTGWSQPAAWGIVEFDIINGAWKINDFTFGSRAILQQAIHVNTPAVIPYRA